MPDGVFASWHAWRCATKWGFLSYPPRRHHVGTRARSHPSRIASRFVAVNIHLGVASRGLAPSARHGLRVGARPCRRTSDGTGGSRLELTVKKANRVPPREPLSETAISTRSSAPVDSVCRLGAPFGKHF